MVRLLLFDLCRWLAPGRARLRSAVLSDLAAIPTELRADMGMTDARFADVVHAQVCAGVAARRADEARRLLDLLNRIARKRGFPRVRWRSEATP